MKNLFAFLTVLTMMALASCTGHSGNTEILSESGNTALDLYYQYADRENLTVAYLGDFSLEGCKIDALMIQANDEEDWEQLKNEFGMQSDADSLWDSSASPEGEKKVSVGLEIDADFVSELGLDTITDLGQVDERRFNRMTQIIADKMREVVNATVADDSPVIIGDKSMSLDEYLNTLAVAVANDLLNEVVEKNKAARQNDTLDASNMEAGDSTRRGYVSAADNNNRTIWLFFYNSQEECNNILTHIREDIVFKDRILTPALSSRRGR